MYQQRSATPSRYGKKNFSGGSGPKRFGSSANSGSYQKSSADGSFHKTSKPSSNFSSFKRNDNGAKSTGGYFRSRPQGSGSSFAGRRNVGKRRGDVIDVSKFVKKCSNLVPETPVEIKHTFMDFQFSKELNTNLNKRNYVKPTPIQDQSIVHIMAGRDLIGLANTGTGKTAAFLLPLIEKVWKNKSERVLIIAPTRELAMQINTELLNFSYDMRLFSAACVGGMPAFKQINSLRRNPNFVIGTPGRLKDFSDRGLIRYESFTNIVLDEVDRMLDMGFVDEIKEILKKLPTPHQSLFFSATMPPKIKDFIGQFLNNPIKVEIQSGHGRDNVDQDIVRTRGGENKFEQLSEILRDPEFAKVLIFIETKREVEKLARGLADHGFRAESIHGDKRQRERERALTQFKNDTVNILVATDVAARGLDIKDITHVINYTVPQTYDDYIHRIGRTGRGDATGKALTFVEGF